MCVCVCVFLFLLHIKHQNTYSSNKVGGKWGQVFWLRVSWDGLGKELEKALCL